MGSVFKRAADKSRKGSRWLIAYVDENGERKSRVGFSDKGESERLLREIEIDVDRKRRGTVDPKAERRAQAERTSIAEHLENFIDTLRAKGRVERYVANTAMLIVRVFETAGIGRLSAIEADRVELALARLKARGLSARSINASATAVKAFSLWAWRTGLTADYPLGTVSRRNEDADRRLERRALSPDEQRSLIQSTRSAPVWHGMSGIDRSWFYAIALSTGYRRAELASLTPASFRLDAQPPTIDVQASETKNGEQAGQPVSPALANALRVWLASKPPGRPVFDPLPQQTKPMLASDLTRAGIDPVDADGRTVDVHALRHSFITTLGAAGLPAALVQSLARHSDPKLTMRYMDMSQFDAAAAVAKLPGVFIDISDSAHAAPAQRARVVSSRLESLVDAKAPSLHDPSMDRKSLGNQGFDASCRNVTLVVAKLPGLDSNQEKQIQSLL